MTEEEIKNLLQDNIDDAYSFVETEVNADRKRAMEYYLRQPYGNEVSGKSSVVTGEVAAVGRQPIEQTRQIPRPGFRQDRLQ